MSSGLRSAGNGAGHDADRLALVGHGDTLPDDAVQVRVFLVQVKVEMELEGGGGTRRLQRVAGGDRIVQGVERAIEASVVFLVRLGDQRRDLFKGGEDGQFLPVGVPHQNSHSNPLVILPPQLRARPVADSSGIGRCRDL